MYYKNLCYIHINSNSFSVCQTGGFHYIISGESFINKIVTVAQAPAFLAFTDN